MKFLSHQFFLITTLINLSCFLIRMILFRSGLIFIVKKWWRSFEDCFHVYQYFKIPEFNENWEENQLYKKIYAYLTSLTSSIEDSDFTNLIGGKKPTDIVLCLDANQIIEDNFLRAKIFWINEEKNQITNSTNRRNFVLKIRKFDKRRILRPYLQHIHTVISDESEQKNRELKLYVSSKRELIKSWISVPFTHPSNFDAITMEIQLKNKIKSDLESFLRSKQYYHKLGRVWKRSYLLYGPSGTGKSSFIAAMANFLGFDIYVIDLSQVSDYSDLQFLLLKTTSKSIIVVEDLDRYLIGKISTSASFSSLLNFMDGILTSCGAHERVMAYTMNSKKQVDPDFLRPGRIDVHIHFPLCDFWAFKNLANNYLGLTDHRLFPQVEQIFQNGASLSPAEISELMIANWNSPNRAIKSVILALQTDGDGREIKLIERHSSSRNESEEEPVEPSGMFCMENNKVGGRERRKLYGLLRIKSNRVSHSLDLSPTLKDD